MSKVINIPGWQSWSSVSSSPFRHPSYLYSPHRQDSWKITVPKPLSRSPIAGWCSWYAFGRNINEKKILDNSLFFADRIKTALPTYILIDDGWCKWGDWTRPHPRKFPSGMRKTSQKIKNMGLKPGLWLAPFLTDSSTHHRLRTFPYKYVIDLEISRTLKQILDSISVIVEKWGFEMLKLDFLYALHFLPRYKDSAIPDELLKSFLSAVKKLYPHVHLNICGCPLGPAVGMADSMRISADIVNPYLDHIWPINKISTYHQALFGFSILTHLSADNRLGSPHPRSPNFNP